jgi:hypothetical protein
MVIIAAFVTARRLDVPTNQSSGSPFIIMSPATLPTEFDGWMIHDVDVPPEDDRAQKPATSPPATRQSLITSSTPSSRIDGHGERSPCNGSHIVGRFPEPLDVVMEDVEGSSRTITPPSAAFSRHEPAVHQPTMTIAP